MFRYYLSTVQCSRLGSVSIPALLRMIFYWLSLGVNEKFKTKWETSCHVGEQILSGSLSKLMGRQNLDYLK